MNFKDLDAAYSPTKPGGFLSESQLRYKKQKQKRKNTCEMKAGGLKTRMEQRFFENSQTLIRGALGLINLLPPDVNEPKI